MPETEGNQQRCCILGVCCPPGGPAQRAALKSWLLSKIAAGAQEAEDQTLSATVDGWLDELPWGEKAE